MTRGRGGAWWLVSMVALSCLVACGGPGGRTTSLQKDAQELQREIRESQTAIAAAREEAERLGEQLESETARVSSLLTAHADAGDQVMISLPAELVSQVVRGLLDGYGGVVPADGDRPEARWELRGIRTRPARERLFVTGSYNIRIGERECDGPVHGHLVYLERNLLKLTDMEMRCRTQGHELVVDVASQVAPLPVPFDVVASWPLRPSPDVRIKRKRLDLVIPVQLRLGASRVSAGARAVQVR